MRIWKWLGWDTREHRTARVLNGNWHGTARTIAWCVGLVIAAYLIWG